MYRYIGELSIYVCQKPFHNSPSTVLCVHVLYAFYKIYAYFQSYRSISSIWLNCIHLSIISMTLYMDNILYFIKQIHVYGCNPSTGELGYDGLNGTRKIGPSYAKSVVYI